MYIAGIELMATILDNDKRVQKIPFLELKTSISARVRHQVPLRKKNLETFSAFPSCLDKQGCFLEGSLTHISVPAISYTPED